MSYLWDKVRRRNADGPGAQLHGLLKSGIKDGFKKKELVSYLNIGESAWLPWRPKYPFSEAMLPIDAERILAVLGGLARAQIHQRRVHREPMQPGREQALEAKALQLLPGAHECFLGELLGARIDAAHQPPDRAVHAPRVAAVQVLEGTHVAARGTAHRVRIGVVGAFRDRRFRTRHGECEGVHPDNIDAPGHAGV